MAASVGTPQSLKKDEYALQETGSHVRVGDCETINVPNHHHFNVWSTIGINYSTIGTPMSIGTYLAFNVGVGGSPVFIFGYILAAIFQVIVCFSLAEMAGAYPHSTGQVYWTTVLAPPRFSRILSYWVGAFMSAAWFFWTAGTYLLSAQIVLAAAKMTKTSFEIQNYHVYLCYLGGAALAVFLNNYLFKAYSLLMRVMMFAINVGAVMVLVALLVQATPKRDVHVVFIDLVNKTGWESNGLVFLLGCLPGITAINGFDSATHLTDEIPDPARHIPKVMVWTAVLAALSGLPMTIALMFCVVNEDNLLNPIGGQPLAQLFLDSLNSLPLALFLQAVYTMVFYISCAAITTTFSRVLWSLARERHMFIHTWLSKLTGKNELPQNAVYASAILSCAIGLLCLGPTTALNAILGSAAICFFCSYIIPIVCLLINRKALGEPERPMNLGVWGVLLNLLALIWMVVMSICLLFPQYIPITASTMNYTVAVLGGVVLTYGINWALFAKDNYML